MAREGARTPVQTRILRGVLDHPAGNQFARGVCRFSPEYLMAVLVSEDSRTNRVSICGILREMNLPTI
jgi:hypothetical protein